MKPFFYFLSSCAAYAAGKTTVFIAHVYISWGPIIGGLLVLLIGSFIASIVFITREIHRYAVGRMQHDALRAFAALHKTLDILTNMKKTPVYEIVFSRPLHIKAGVKWLRPRRFDTLRTR